MIRFVTFTFGPTAFGMYMYKYLSISPFSVFISYLIYLLPQEVCANAFGRGISSHFSYWVWGFSHQAGTSLIASVVLHLCCAFCN